MFALSVNGVVYSTVVGMYLDSRCFQSEVGCEERETADIDNLLQNVCFKTKKKSKMLLCMSGASSKVFPQDGNRYNRDFPGSMTQDQTYAELLEKYGPGFCCRLKYFKI